MRKNLLLLVIVALAGLFGCGGPPLSDAAFATLPAEAERLAQTPEGKAYGKAFSTAIAVRFAQARDEAMGKLKLRPPQSIEIIFVVSSGGQITGTIAAIDQPLSTYISKKLMGFRVPSPPHDNYPVRVQMH